jgi:ATP-dependent exoDNAse (exonuclease V) alpha subunit
MIELFNQAVLLVDMPEKGLAQGDVGVVVEIYGNHEGYELEFMTKDGRTVAVETLMADQVRAISGRDMWHVRELAQIA